MVSQAKRRYVLDQHSRAITQLSGATGPKRGKWKTYIYENDRRKEVLRKTEEEMYEFLYRFYKAREDQPKTLRAVFGRYAEYKAECMGRTRKTILEDERRVRLLGDKILETPISRVTEEMLRRWFVTTFMKRRPTEADLRKQMQVLNQTFEYGMRIRVCKENPMRYLSPHDYMSGCRRRKKLNEEKEFSEDELELIRKESLKGRQTVRVLMRLFAMETGLRVGELPVVHKTDIRDGFIHVHRQQ